MQCRQGRPREGKKAVSIKGLADASPRAIGFLLVFFDWSGVCRLRPGVYCPGQTIFAPGLLRFVRFHTLLEALDALRQVRHQLWNLAPAEQQQEQDHHQRNLPETQSHRRTPSMDFKYSNSA